MIKEFFDNHGINLIIENNKTNIIFKTDDKNIEINKVKEVLSCAIL